MNIFKKIQLRLSPQRIPGEPEALTYHRIRLLELQESMSKAQSDMMNDKNIPVKYRAISLMILYATLHSTYGGVLDKMVKTTDILNDDEIGELARTVCEKYGVGENNETKQPPDYIG